MCKLTFLGCLPPYFTFFDTCVLMKCVLETKLKGKMGEPSNSDVAAATTTRNSLECIVCRDAFRKLKLLSCEHSFCNGCLARLIERGKIRCPYCRRETALTEFGVEDLPGQFGGTLQCCECEKQADMKQTSWCSYCKLILCRYEYSKL